jgi:hypothetical protein
MTFLRWYEQAWPLISEGDSGAHLSRGFDSRQAIKSAHISNCEACRTHGKIMTMKDGDTLGARRTRTGYSGG